MLQYTVEAQGLPPHLDDGCQRCCCETWHVKPGVSEKVLGRYAPWTMPLGRGRLGCGTRFELEQKQTCPVPTTGNVPPRPEELVAFDTLVNTAMTADLKDKVTDPDGDPLSFKQLSLWGPHHGIVEIADDGEFAYTPDDNFNGVDRFYASVSDGVNPPVIFEVMIGVGISALTAKPTPHVQVDMANVNINEAWHELTFPLRVSPAAQLCETWRLTVLQGAYDCDCVCYQRTDCFDIRIAKC